MVFFITARHAFKRITEMQPGRKFWQFQKMFRKLFLKLSEFILKPK
jgi:hypothetical protein